MTTMQQVADGQSYPEVPINENFDAVSAFALFGKRHAGTSGLTWAYYGGYYDSVLIADDDVALTDDDVNYIVVERATGVVSVDIATTNWADTAAYGRLYLVTAAAGSVADIEDHRFGAGGILTSSGAVSVDATDVTYTPGTSNSAFTTDIATVQDAIDLLADLAAGSAGVVSVNGETGVVTLTAADIAILDSDSAFVGATVEEALESLGKVAFMLYFGGAPTASEQVFKSSMRQALSLPASLTGSKFVIDVNPTATMTWTLLKNGGSIGTVAFDTAGAPTVTFASPVSFAIDDTFSVVAPSSPDATGADASFNILFSRA